MKSFLLIILLSTFALLLSPSAFPQGSLTPPGAPTPTMKTLDQVQPRTPVDAAHTPGDANNVFIISQPGAYYLTGNLTVPFTSTNCIQIAADHVTLDLNGFALVGGGGTGIGINIPAAHTNFSLRNGIIRNWGGGAVLAGSTSNSLYENLQVSNNGSGGGLVAGDTCVITKCVAFQNAATGIRGGIASTITACSSRSNSSGGNGFAVNMGSTITGCSAATNNGVGILVSQSCTVTQCSVYLSNGVGVSAGDWSTVSRCTVSNGNDNGIVLSSDCIALENVCANNGVSVPGGFAGILVSGFANRIEGNNLPSNLNRGVKVTSSNNLIIRNSASNNGVNYDIVAGNAVGPVVIAPASAAISGNSAPAASVGSTNPWANFSY